MVQSPARVRRPTVGVDQLQVFERRHNAVDVRPVRREPRPATVVSNILRGRLPSDIRVRRIANAASTLPCRQWSKHNAARAPLRTDTAGLTCCDCCCDYVCSYDRVEVNGETIYDAEDDHDPAAPADGYVRGEVCSNCKFPHICVSNRSLRERCERRRRGQGYDPWYEQDRCFVEDVRDRKAGRSPQANAAGARRLVNDYADGLRSLGPVLAAWDSARRGGEMIDVKSFVDVPAEVPVPA